MTFIQSLKELAYKVTGKTPTSNTENGVLTEFANDYISDGGSDIFWITFSLSNRTFTADKTYSEILSAIESNKAISIKYLSVEGHHHFAVFSAFEVDGDHYRMNMIDGFDSKIKSRWTYTGFLNDHPTFTLS